MWCPVFLAEMNWHSKATCRWLQVFLRAADWFSTAVVSVKLCDDDMLRIISRLWNLSGKLNANDWRCCWQIAMTKLRIAIIGQSLFGAEVYRLLRSQHHEVVGVFTIPDVNGRPDPLGIASDVFRELIVAQSNLFIKTTVIFLVNCE